jgi:lysophospholipase L1-like esterase
VILATLTPQRPGSTKGTTSPADIRTINARILDLCRRYQTGCADLYTAFGGEQSPLIGTDGLHPTPAGYDLIAETYFEVIRRLFERTAGVLPLS